MVLLNVVYLKCKNTILIKPVKRISNLIQLAMKYRGHPDVSVKPSHSNSDATPLMVAP
jgi:hypothetical protein